MATEYKFVEEIKVKPGTVIELVRLVKEIRKLTVGATGIACTCGLVTKCMRCRVGLLLDESKVVKEFKL